MLPFGRHPNVLPSTQSALDSRLVHAQGLEGGAATGGVLAAAVQFMIGVVKSIGDARMAHIENSVTDSSIVTLGGPRVGSKPDAGPVPVWSISMSFQP